MGGGGGRPLEATGGHTGQFPRTDAGPFCKSSPLSTPPESLKLRLFGGIRSSCVAHNIYIYTNVDLSIKSTGLEVESIGTRLRFFFLIK